MSHFLQLWYLIGALGKKILFLWQTPKNILVLKIHGWSLVTPNTLTTSLSKTQITGDRMFTTHEEQQTNTQKKTGTEWERKYTQQQQSLLNKQLCMSVEHRAGSTVPEVPLTFKTAVILVCEEIYINCTHCACYWHCCKQRSLDTAAVCVVFCCQCIQFTCNNINFAQGWLTHCKIHFPSEKDNWPVLNARIWRSF